MGAEAIPRASYSLLSSTSQACDVVVNASQLDLKQILFLAPCKPVAGFLVGAERVSQVEMCGWFGSHVFKRTFKMGELVMHSQKPFQELMHCFHSCSSHGFTPPVFAARSFFRVFRTLLGFSACYNMISKALCNIIERVSAAWPHGSINFTLMGFLACLNMISKALCTIIERV